MISRCQGDGIFVVFQLMGIFFFWRKGEFTFFSKDVYSPSFYLNPNPPPSTLVPEVFLDFSPLEMREAQSGDQYHGIMSREAARKKNLWLLWT